MVIDERFVVIRIGIGEDTHVASVVPSTPTKVAFSPIVIALQDGTRIYHHGDGVEAPILNPGEYTVKVKILAGEQTWRADRDFKVGGHPYELYWS